MTPTPSNTPSNTPTSTPSSTACPGLTPTLSPSSSPPPASQTPTSTPTGTNPPPPTPSITTTNTPTPTFTCDCREWYVANENPFSIQITYTDCETLETLQFTLGAFLDITICSCLEPYGSGGSAFTEDQGPCELEPTPTPSITPTNTPTNTNTPTPSLTPDCFLSWNIDECSGTCSGGLCVCEGSTPITVYTDCSVVDITNNDTQLYDTSSLISPYTGDFVYGGSIYTSNGSSVSLVCVVGGPC